MISFKTLDEKDFPLLLKWLTTDHVRKYWEPDIDWTLEKIVEKYSIREKIYMFIIYNNAEPIGFIQYYNAYDFQQNPILKDLPESLAAIDLYIGEASYIGKGLGGKIIDQFIKEHLQGKFDEVLVDPDIVNVNAIKAYEKAGFNKIRQVDNVIWMVRKCRN